MNEELRFLVRFAPPPGDRATMLALLRGIAKSLGVDPRSPKWTSHGALEFDLFAPGRGDVDLFLAAVEPLVKVDFLNDLSALSPYKTEHEALAGAVDLFNQERYWECHEVLEGVWRTKVGQDKRTLQGVILVCAAFVHHQKGEEPVALGILPRAESALDGAPLAYGALDIAKLKKQVYLASQRGSLTVFTI